MKRKTFWWLIGRLVVPPREFRRKRKRIIGSIVLIALVMIPLVVSILFTESMIQGMTDKYVMLQDGHIQAYDFVLGSDTQLGDERIFSADHSASVFGIAYSKTQTSEVKVKGVYPSYFNEARLQEISIDGTLPEYSGSAVPSVMMSSTTAKTLGVAIGERIALMLVPDSGTISARPVLARIDALYESGYRQIDATLMFMHIDDLLKFNTAGYSKRTEFIVQNESADNLSSVIDSLRQTYNPNIRWATWEAFNRSVYQNFMTSRQVILTVLIMISLVAGTYVSSIAAELVQDSHQSIALLKTLGATSANIHQAFFLTVACTTTLGLIIGMGIGLLLGTRLQSVLLWLAKADIPALRYYLLDFSLKIPWMILLEVAAALLGISAVTVLIALRRIRKISPLELLQQE